MWGIIATALLQQLYLLGMWGADADEGQDPPIGPLTLDRLSLAFSGGASGLSGLPLCAQRLHAALHATDPAARPPRLSPASSSSALGSWGALPPALKSGWLHHDHRRQVIAHAALVTCLGETNEPLCLIAVDCSMEQYLLFLKSCGLSVGATLAVFRRAHERASAAAEGEVLVRPKRKWDRCANAAP